MATDVTGVKSKICFRICAWLCSKEHEERITNWLQLQMLKGRVALKKRSLGDGFKQTGKRGSRKDWVQLASVVDQRWACCNQAGGDSLWQRCVQKRTWITRSQGTWSKIYNRENWEGVCCCCSVTLGPSQVLRENFEPALAPSNAPKRQASLALVFSLFLVNFWKKSKDFPKKTPFLNDFNKNSRFFDFFGWIFDLVRALSSTLLESWVFSQLSTDFAWISTHVLPKKKARKNRVRSE